MSPSTGLPATVSAEDSADVRMVLAVLPFASVTLTAVPYAALMASLSPTATAWSFQTTLLVLVLLEAQNTLYVTAPSFQDLGKGIANCVYSGVSASNAYPEISGLPAVSSVCAASAPLVVVGVMEPASTGMVSLPASLTPSKNRW